MFRWSKAPCTLKFTVASVDIHTDIGSKFKLAWQRGSAAGQTDVVKPLNQLVTFDASFECHCKMYIGKHDKSVRPKKVKFVLSRLSKDKGEKVYGRLTIDIGAFYGVTTVSHVDRDMESGRGKAPTMHAQFMLFPIGQEMEATENDIDDESFAGEPDKRVEFSDWDVTDAASESSEHKRKKKKRRKTSDVEAESRKRRSEGDLLMQVTSQLRERRATDERERKKHHHKKHHGQEKRKEADDQRNEEEEIPKEKKVSEEKLQIKEKGEDEAQEIEKKEANEVEEIQDKNQGEEVPKMQQAAPEEKVETEMVVDQKSTQERDEEALMQISTEYFFHIVLTHVWPPMKEPPLLLEDLPYPPMTFPIFAAILHTGILMTDIDDDHFISVLSIIIADLQIMPASVGDRFLTTMTLILLVEKNQAEFGFDEDKSHTMRHELKRVCEQQLAKILQPALIRSEMLINRLCTSSFEFDSLLLDFKEVMQMNKDSFLFGDTVNRLLFERSVALFDYKLVNKILTNPMRFSFSNSMVWNSFLTALENDERISMKLTRQLISALIMAPSISTMPEMAGEVCPDLRKTVVVYILYHYQTDANVPEKLSVYEAAKGFGIECVPEVLELVTPPKAELSKLLSEARLDDWRNCSPTEDFLHHFSYLEDYVDVKQTV